MTDKPSSWLAGVELVDLTRLLDPDDADLLPERVRHLSGILAPSIDYFHPTREGRFQFAAALQCGVEDLPDGEGWGAERIAEFGTHVGTHVDAPLHYGSTSEGKPSRTISDIELSELFVEAIVADVRPDARPNQPVNPVMLDAAIDRAGAPVPAGGAVLVRTGQERYGLSDDGYYEYPGMTRDATLHLAELGAKVLGTDAPGWDLPFEVMAERFRSTGDNTHLWDGHKAGREREVFIVQQLVNLAALPSAGFHVGFFPLRLARASAAPARVVAFVPAGTR
jgi:kynurenine formamidase